ncbi:MAG TPA: MATE family efflux transporter, partial [Taishania sp.]|nr:MATE family efflux transporter [Taishania sp.]
LPKFIQGYAANEQIALMQGEYLSIRSIALFFAVIQFPLQAYYFAWGRSIIPFIATMFTAAGNIFLDYVLIFGKMGFPEMGLGGAAWASTIADGLGALFLLSYTILSKEYIKQKLFQTWNAEWDSIKELMKLSIPIILQGTLALMVWAVYFAWIEQIGVFEVTVSQNIRSIYFLAFIPVFGFGATTKTYVSQYFGAKKLALIPVIQKRIILLSILSMIVVFHGSILYPEQLIKLINPNEAFIAKSAETLKFIGCSMFLFCIGGVFLHSINGLGRTHITLLIEIIITGSYLLYSYFTIKVWEWDVKMIWSVEYVYFTLMTILSFSYLKLSKWKKQI